MVRVMVRGVPGSPIRMLYRFKGSARINRRMKFADTAEAVVHKHFERNFRKRLYRALATAR